MVAITWGDETEPVHAMMRKVIALFDEYQSKENAKHVIRSMKENARQGFWNGADPLFFRCISAGGLRRSVLLALLFSLSSGPAVHRCHRGGVPAPLCHKYLSRSGAGMTIYGATRTPPKRELSTRHSRHCFDKTPVQALRSVTWHAKPRKRASGGPAIA